MPLDEGVKHPFGPWAKVVGGILQANQFSDFLANYGVRKMADDPVRRGLGLLGVDSPDMSLLEGNSPKNWKTASDWAQIALKLGLVKTVIPVADRDSKEGRARGIGTVLTAHRDETFIAENDKQRLTMKLEKRKARFGTTEPHFRYRFAIVGRDDLADEVTDDDAHPEHGRA